MQSGSNVGAKDRFRPLFSTKIGLKWAALCHFSKWSDDRVLAGTTWNMKYCGWQQLPAGFNWATAVSPLQEATPEGLLFSNLKCKILEFLSTTTWYGKSFNESQNTDGPEWWLMWSFSSFNVKDIHCPFSPLIILVQEATPVFFISRLFRVFHQVHWFQNLGSSVFARRSSAPLYFRIFSSTDNSRPLLMIQALSVSSEPRCTAVRRSKAPPHNHQATQSTTPPPPSISQSTMKRVTIRAGALLFRSQCLLSNNIICHRGRNLGGCAPVLDSQYLHCFEVEKIVLLIHRRSRLRFKQLASLLFLRVWGS